MSRHNRIDTKRRKVNREIAVARPELRAPSDGFARRAPSSPFSAPIKVQDEATARLIAEFQTRRTGP